MMGLILISVWQARSFPHLVDLPYASVPQAIKTRLYLQDLILPAVLAAPGLTGRVLNMVYGLAQQPFPPRSCRRGPVLRRLRVLVGSHARRDVHRFL